MIKENLKGKVVVITGGTGVLGIEWAKGFLEAGSKVVILGLNYNKGVNLEEKLKKINSKNIKFLKCDVLNEHSVSEAKKLINNLYGNCDILINGAGGNKKSATCNQEDFNIKSKESSFFNIDIDAINDVFNLNYIGTLIPIKIFANDLLKSKAGSIINISSMSSFRPLTKVPYYSSAKASINNLTKWLAKHFAKTGIRVNAIAPGFFETEQNKELLRTKSGNLTQRSKKILSQTPMARFGDPSEIVPAILFLADSSKSGFITGIVLEIDGGFGSYSGV